MGKQVYGGAGGSVRACVRVCALLGNLGCVVKCVLHVKVGGGRGFTVNRMGAFRFHKGGILHIALL